MAVTVELDRMIHARAVLPAAGNQSRREIGLEGDCASSGSDLNPIDLLAMSTAACLMIVMAKGAKARGIDLTGTWADAVCDLEKYVIQSIRVTVYSPFRPSDEDRAFLEKESHQCPVYLAVKDGANVKVSFEWGSSAQPKAKGGQALSAGCGGAVKT
jgi:uncharacterized OsmC-like protein